MSQATIGNAPKEQLNRILNVTSAFQELTSRINIMIRLEGMLYGPLEYIVSASILAAVEYHTDCLKELREDNDAIVEAMNDTEQKEWKELMELIVGVEKEVVRVETALKEKIEAYEEKNHINRTA